MLGRFDATQISTEIPPFTAPTISLPRYSSMPVPARSILDNILLNEQIKKPVSGKTGKEAVNDVPSWAKGKAPYITENGKDFAKRLCNEKYGLGNYPTGSGSEYNKIKKWGDRGFK